MGEETRRNIEGYGRGLDVIDVSEQCRRSCVTKIFLYRLPESLTLLFFGVIIVVPIIKIAHADFADNPIMSLVVDSMVIGICLFILSFTQKDTRKLLDGDFKIYGGVCMWLKENHAGDSTGRFQSIEKQRAEQNSYGLFVTANDVELACARECYHHVGRGRYVYILEVNKKKTWRNQEYYFLNAPKGVEPQRRSGYYPEK